MSSNIKRKVAAIMFTDIAGYTEQMSKDEDKAFALIQKKRELLLPIIKKHKGKLIKEIGDGTLTRYFKADNAINCASTFQSKTDIDLNVRAGIHTGEVIVDNEDVFGDVVNVASRLESIAVPGSVLVSKETIDKLDISDSVEFVSLGMQSMKGIGRLIEVYAIKDESLVVPNPDDYLENKINVHSDDEVPSVAIIPFENKGKQEDVFYAYGIYVDLISDVSSAGLIRVASKNEIEDAGDLPQDKLAKKLFVRYIANGELWRMGNMFQLSVELYDTKDKKLVWSDRWQEKWDNLPTIKMKLSDGLLKALDTTSKVEKKAETTNTKAYELYLKAKHTYERRTDTNDTEKARKFLHQAIELDDNLIAAKLLLGTSYLRMGYKDEAMNIYTTALEQAEKMADKIWIGAALNNIGVVYEHKRNYEKALEYYDRALMILEETEHKRGMGGALNNIGNINKDKGDYDKALEYYDRALMILEETEHKRGMGGALNNIGLVHSCKGEYDTVLEYYGKSLTIQEEIGDKRGMGLTLNNIGVVHDDKGEYDKALEYFDKSLKIREEIGDKGGMALTLNNIGRIYYCKEVYDTALEYLDKSLKIQQELVFKAIELVTTTLIYLSYKHLGKKYDKKNIYSLIKDAENISFGLNFRLYQLLGDTSYLETAYTYLQEIVSTMEEETRKTYLGYPLPTAIVEEWEKVQ